MLETGVWSHENAVFTRMETFLRVTFLLGRRKNLSGRGFLGGMQYVVCPA